MSVDLRWARTETGSYKSECGRYTIRRIRTRRWSAHCWRQTATGSVSWSAPFSTLRDAKSRCALDARGAARYAEIYGEPVMSE